MEDLYIQSEDFEIKPDIHAAESVCLLPKLNYYFERQTTHKDILYLGGLTTLEKFRLEYVDLPMGDLSALSNCIPLRSINLRDTPLKSFSGALDLPNLREVRIYEIGIDSLHGLENHPALEYLDISRANLKSLEGLDTIPNLVSAGFSNCDVTEADLPSSDPEFVSKVTF